MRILVLQSGGIGDAVMSLPALRALKEAFPEARIDAALVQLAPEAILTEEFCDRAFLIPYGLSKSLLQSAFALRQERYDICFVPSGAHPWKAGLISWLAGAKARLGEQRGKLPSLFYTHTAFFRGTLHIVESNEKILAAFGIPVRHKLPSLRVNSEAARKAEEFFSEHDLLSRKVVGLHFGSSLLGGAKRWPMERAQQFGVLLKERRSEARILLFGSPSETEFCAEAAEKIGDIAALAVGQPLAESVALLARCTAFVGPDGGLAHIAAALGIPTVVLFGPTDPRRFSPRGERVSIIQEYCRDMRTDKPRAGKHECLGRITPKRVFIELTKMGF